MALQATKGHENRFDSQPSDLPQRRISGTWVGHIGGMANSATWDGLPSQRATGIQMH
jgi:hypothetical protein